MYKRLTASIIAVFLMFLAGGCDNEHYTEYGGEITSMNASEMSSVKESQAVSAALARTRAENEKEDDEDIKTETSYRIADRMGNMVEVPEYADTIVSLSPATTEILVGLGLAEKIIAADVFSSDVEGVNTDVCNLDMIHPDIQAIAALAPDIIIIGELSGGLETAAEFDNMGLYTAFIPTPKNIEGIKMDIEFLAGLTGTVPAGMKLISQMNTDLAYISDRLPVFTDDRPSLPKVYLEINEYPDVWVAGDNTFISAAIEYAGGVTYFAGTNGYLSMTDADILGADGVPIQPDIILSAVRYEGYDVSEIESRAGWDAINAVREGNIHAIDPNTILRPSQNITAGVMEIAKILYPEVFAEPMNTDY
jgi:iron complex transport system substrate-binding protein